MYLNLLFLIPLVLSLRTLIVLYSYFYSSYDYWFESSGLDETNVFDFIVVGGGSAGALLSARLSLHHTVLLIEAGGDPLPMQKVPGFAGEFLHRPQTDWMHETVPQKYSQFGQTKPGVSRWPRGKSIGGSSNLNSMMYVRSHPLDYDNWAGLTGDPSWKYENLLSFFKKHLNYNGKFQENHLHYGNGGSGHSLNVENKDNEKINSVAEHFKNAGQELGFDIIPDLNGPQKMGFGSIEFTQKDGGRRSTFHTFIEPILHRKNLVISRYSQATKIQLDKENQAVGVKYLRHGQKMTARAKKEIIVSCGSVDSPKLLMLSGIGPKTHLAQIGIKSRVDLPVGQNLHDHLAVFTPPIVLNTSFDISERFSIQPMEDFNLSEFYNYFVHGTGPLSNPLKITAQAFISASFAKNETSQNYWPDIQYIVTQLGSTMVPDLSPVFGWNPAQLKGLWSGAAGKDSFALTIILARPESKGQLTLRDRDPLSPPLINPNYLGNQNDLLKLVQGIKIAVNLTERTKSFKKFGAIFGPSLLPACQNERMENDDYWKCFVKFMGTTTYHPVGTCRMGRVDDSRSVVDSQFKVIGVKGLRVVDASVMPEICNGNTYAPTLMIAEKAAHIIRQYWTQQSQVCSVEEGLAPFFKYPSQLGTFGREREMRSDKCFYSELS